MTIDNRHPVYELICAALSDVTGELFLGSGVSAPPGSEHAIDPDRPLGQESVIAFRAMLHLCRSSKPFSLEVMSRLLASVPRRRLDSFVNAFVQSGFVRTTSDSIELTPLVPVTYRELVRQLGSLLAKRDQRLAEESASAISRVYGFKQASDSAPLLFGTDIRLRNLMALAKYGAMYYRDLRHLSGSEVTPVENRDRAPFGRAALVRSWDTEDGSVAELDPAAPIWLPLRKLLLKLEASYPLPSLPLCEQPPSFGECSEWKGDKFAIFGGEIVTTILISIGVLGWTFEGLCVATCVGYERVVVKKALKKLENMGILEGDRARKPGFNVRIVTLSSSFVARPELTLLLKCCAAVWPSYRERVDVALRHLSARTAKHLQSRGLSIEVLKPPCERWWRDLDPAERVEHCLVRYFAAASEARGEISGSDLMRVDSNLYRRITKVWPSFAAFRQDAGLPSKLTGIPQKPNDVLRERCITRYFLLARSLGHQPNTAELIRVDPTLCEWVRVQWGGFPAFCSDVGVLPVRTHKKSSAPNEAQRKACLNEYRALERRLGHTPSSVDMRIHTSGLYKRIKKLWGGVAEFRKAI